jgi:hypothetical protein
MLALGFLLMGCTSLGTAGYNPPSGTYHNGSQGNIVFNGAGAAWEAPEMGYKGSFDFDAATAEISLTADQKLEGLRWVAIDPIPGFTNGQVKESTVTLGDFSFYIPPED